MELKVTEGCTAFSYTVNDKEWVDLSNEERKDVLLKIIQSQNNFNNCQEIFTSLVQEFGQYNFLGHCEDCGDYITTYILEIK